MADTKGYVQITDEQLAKSAVKYRKELLMMPVLAMASTLQHMSQRPGVIGKETVGEVNGDIEIGPYDEGRVDENGVSIDPRTLETFLGSVVKKFSPNSVWQTVYGNLISKGEALKNVDITRQVLAFLSAKLGANLNAVLWSAKRNESGTKSKDRDDDENGKRFNSKVDVRRKIFAVYMDCRDDFMSFVSRNTIQNMVKKNIC